MLSFIILTLAMSFGLVAYIVAQVHRLSDTRQHISGKRADRAGRGVLFHAASANDD
jgi:hypothetical protein